MNATPALPAYADDCGTCSARDFVTLGWCSNLKIDVSAEIVACWFRAGIEDSQAAKSVGSRIENARLEGRLYCIGMQFLDARDLMAGKLEAGQLMSEQLMDGSSIPLFQGIDCKSPIARPSDCLVHSGQGSAIRKQRGRHRRLG